VTRRHQVSGPEDPRQAAGDSGEAERWRVGVRRPRRGRSQRSPGATPTYAEFAPASCRGARGGTQVMAARARWRRCRASRGWSCRSAVRGRAGHCRRVPRGGGPPGGRSRVTPGSRDGGAGDRAGGERVSALGNRGRGRDYRGGGGGRRTGPDTTTGHLGPGGAILRQAPPAGTAAGRRAWPAGPGGLRAHARAGGRRGPVLHQRDRCRSYAGRGRGKEPRLPRPRSRGSS